MPSPTWVNGLQELHGARVDLFLHQQKRLDTTTPAGKAMFGMMGVFAEFERSMICGPCQCRNGARQGQRDQIGQGNRQASHHPQVRAAHP